MAYWARLKSNKAAVHSLKFKGSKGKMTTSKNSVESKEFEVLSTEGILVVHLYDCCPDAFQGNR